MKFKTFNNLKDARVKAAFLAKMYQVDYLRSIRGSGLTTVQEEENILSDMIKLEGYEARQRGK